MLKKICFYIVISIGFTVNGQVTEELGGETWNISKNIIQSKENTNNKIAFKYWSYLNNKLPSKILHRYITRLRLFTDGIHDELGGVTPLNDLNSKWEINIDTLDFDLKSKDSLHIQNYVHTIIHEFGHLLTLNQQQVTITQDEFQDDQKGYLTSEGYAGINSYLGKFVTQFWDGKLLRKWDKIEKIRNTDRKLNRLYKFYLKNKNQFLTDYAAESPEEDIAESWTFFVLSNKPTKQLIKHRKVLFFYQFPELIAHRAYIRQKIKTIPINYITNYKSLNRDL